MAQVSKYSDFVYRDLKRFIDTPQTGELPPSFGGDNIPPMDPRIDVIEKRLDHIDQGMSDLKADMREVRSELSGIKRWIVGTAIATVAIMAALLSWQASWFQHSLDRNWEISTKALDRIDSHLINSVPPTYKE